MGSWTSSRRPEYSKHSQTLILLKVAQELAKACENHTGVNIVKNQLSNLSIAPPDSPIQVPESFTLLNLLTIDSLISPIKQHPEIIKALTNVIFSTTPRQNQEASPSTAAAAKKPAMQPWRLFPLEYIGNILTLPHRFPT